jgi:hypothetical protein
MGCIPREWNTGNVIPVHVHKSGNKCDPLNYRPISITSAVCKALEKIISGYILEFLRITNQIDDNQHVFLPRRSCNTMHASIINEWQKDLQLDTHSGGHIHVLSLDWEKAFDRIPHARLILKLTAAGITGSLLSWIQCYLSERSQRVLVYVMYTRNGTMLQAEISKVQYWGHCYLTYSYLNSRVVYRHVL